MINDSAPDENKTPVFIITLILGKAKDRTIINRALLWLFLIATVLINLWSCQNTSDENIVRIGFSQAMSQDDWRRAMDNSMKLQASLDPTINLTILDADYKSEKQIEKIEKFIADSMEILIVSPIQ